MADQEYDLVKYAKKKINESNDKKAEKATTSSKAGKLKIEVVFLADGSR